MTELSSINKCYIPTTFKYLQSGQEENNFLTPELDHQKKIWYKTPLIANQVMYLFQSIWWGNGHQLVFFTFQRLSQMPDTVGFMF